MHTSGYPDQDALIVVFLPFGPSHYNPSAMELVCSYFALICYSDPQRLQSCLISEFYVFFTFSPLVIPLPCLEEAMTETRTFGFGVFPVRFIILFVSMQSRNVSRKKLFFWILSKLPPPPLPSNQFGQLVQLFLNAKNIDLSDIQNDSLSKILLK